MTEPSKSTRWYLLEQLAWLQGRLLTMGSDTRVTDVLKTIAETANDVLGGHFCVVMPCDQNRDRFLVEQFTAGGAPKAQSFS